MGAIDRYVQQSASELLKQDATRSLRQSARDAFGGHIAKGFLKRAQKANERMGEASARSLKGKIFLRIKELPCLMGYRCTSETWETVNQICYDCLIPAWPSDPCDYHAASRSFGCYPKVMALRHFVRKYGGKRIQKELSLILFKELPTDEDWSERLPDEINKHK